MTTPGCAAVPTAGGTAVATSYTYFSLSSMRAMAPAPRHRSALELQVQEEGQGHSETGSEHSAVGSTSGARHRESYEALPGQTVNVPLDAVAAIRVAEQDVIKNAREVPGKPRPRLVGDHVLTRCYNYKTEERSKGPQCRCSFRNGLQPLEVMGREKVLDLCSCFLDGAAPDVVKLITVEIFES